MDRNKKEWTLSEHTVNLSRLDTFKVTPYREGIVVCGNKIEGKDLLELIFDKQDLDIEKFVFEKIHISNLQIDDTLKVCIDIDKSLENFQNESNELPKTHTIEYEKKLESTMEQCKKYTEDLKRSMSFPPRLQDIVNQIGSQKEALKMPKLVNPLDNLPDSQKFLQPQEKIPYLFCFEKCTLEKIDFSDEIRHKLKFKGNTFLEHCRTFSKTFLEKVIFLDNVFEQSLLIDKSCFKKELSFKACKSKTDQSITFSYSHFEGETFILGNQFEQLKIESSTFYENIYFGLDYSINPDEGFGYSKFNQSFNLKYTTFVKKAYFERCDFQFCVIESCKFQDDTFFDHSSFDEIRIFKTIFEQRTSFYHATFYQPPLFVNCVFDKYLTMTGLKLGLNHTEFIEKMRNNAINLCDTHNNQRAGTISKPNDRYEPDDFLKDYRDGFCTIKNALIKNNNLLDASYYHRTELYCKELELDSKTQKTLRDRIDLLQLWFYRKTSDHHTDLPKIIFCIIATIGIFSFLYFVLKCLQQTSFFDTINPYGLTFSIVASVISLPFFVFEKKPFFHFKRYALFLFGISVIWIVCYKPKLIFGITNLMGSEDHTWFQNILLVAYTLIMIILIFSLQKTARKNSIIPS